MHKLFSRIFFFFWVAFLGNKERKGKLMINKHSFSRHNANTHSCYFYHTKKRKKKDHYRGRWIRNFLSLSLSPFYLIIHDIVIRIDSYHPSISLDIEKKSSYNSKKKIMSKNVETLSFCLLFAHFLTASLRYSVHIFTHTQAITLNFSSLAI